MDGKLRSECARTGSITAPLAFMTSVTRLEAREESKSTNALGLTLLRRLRLPPLTKATVCGSDITGGGGTGSGCGTRVIWVKDPCWA